MQVFPSTLDEAGRPCAPQDCARCEGLCKLHRHGSYLRYGHPEGGSQVTVPRFLCPRCRRTWSIIPPNMFPYRSLPVTRFEELLDEQSGLTGGGARPPPATQIETGCVRRAAKKLAERIPFLCGLLGQQMPLPQGPGIDWFWQALRELGPTHGILAGLARDYKTSLLACYLSFKAPWHRARAPA